MKFIDRFILNFCCCPQTLRARQFSHGPFINVATRKPLSSGTALQIAVAGTRLHMLSVLTFLSNNYKYILKSTTACLNIQCQSSQNFRLRVCRNLSTSLERHAMPPKRGRPAKAGSTKAVANSKVAPKAPAKKTKREEDDDDEEPVSKKAKTETKKPIMNKVDTKLDDMDFGCEKLNADGDKYNLKISTWNVSGIRAVIKKNGIDYIVKEDADIVALQETKCDSDKLPVEVKIPGYERYFLESKKPGYCGLALYSKVKPIEVKYGVPNSSCNDEGRCITAEYDKFYLINVYVPNAGQKLVTMPKRLKWNEAFKIHVQKLDKLKPVIVCGDLNVAHQEIDLTNPKTNTKNAGFTKEERDGMTDFLDAGFVDTFRDLYPERTGAYTFWSYFNNARGKNIGWRLDYYLVSERIRKNICDNVIRDKVYGSDHCPVILYANL